MSTNQGHSFFILIFIWFHPSLAIGPLRSPEAVVIWNVGQGSWASELRNDHCLHFDLGGERADIKRIKKLCSYKKQFMFISHWDWDHFNFLQKYIADTKNFCIFSPSPSEKKNKAWIKRLILKIQKCSLNEVPKGTQVIFEHKNFSKRLPRSTNEESSIYLSSGFLFPGDSPVRMEKIWMRQVPRSKVKYLVLGHHGSKTSTSEDLLNTLSFIQSAVVSARKAKYGHPHEKVTTRLRKKRLIPLLETEKWGNLWFLL
jgi:competence protein ComEC